MQENQLRQTSKKNQQRMESINSIICRHQHTCNGYLTKADLWRPWQNLWNHIVSTGRAMRNGADCAASFVLISPSRASCEITNAVITRPWTSGQNAAPLSYSWL